VVGPATDVLSFGGRDVGGSGERQSEQRDQPPDVDVVNFPPEVGPPLLPGSPLISETMKAQDRRNRL
jgi:hypothetical protein